MYSCDNYDIRIRKKKTIGGAYLVIKEAFPSPAGKGMGSSAHRHATTCVEAAANTPQN
jgi:hypothetical protein